MILVPGQCQSDQQSLLLQMKNSLTFHSTSSLVQWNQSTDCCTWSGVDCDMAGRVISLDLRGESICGPLPPSMGNLTRLEYLALSSNSFSGPLPPSMGNLTRLEYLALSSNSFSGPLPPSMGNLTRLEYLDLSSNSFSGPLPPSMGNLTQLEDLFLSYNNFSGPLPPSMGNLTQLESLVLSFNSFSGPLPPSMGNLIQLVELALSSNHFTGPLPMSIFEIKSLRFLLLASNKFNGTVQLDVIGRFGNLTYFDLSYNNLTVNVNTSFSSFPPNIRILKLASCKLCKIPNIKNCSLFELDLSVNQISGEIPNWIWEVADTNLNLSHNSLVGFQEPYSIKNLRYLDLHSNRLQGKIPLPPLEARVVDYSSNNFTSSIPDEIGNIAFLMQFFSVSNNKLTGVIPESLCNATRLNVLDLSINNLSGRIPTCLIEMGENLGVLNVKRNNLYGTIPDRFPGNCGFQTLSMNSNQLEGLVPKSLANCTKLEVLDLGNNKINDAFPCWLKNVSSLHVLVLRSNKFYGNISCLEYDVSWPMLQIIDLASNNFTGRLPQKGLTTWEAMMVDEHKAQSQLTHLQFEMQNSYHEIPLGGRVTGLNLSFESISGGIENSKGLFGLQHLQSLDLAYNRCNASQIPSRLANLTNLTYLNLSNAGFVGQIPIAISRLTRLVTLDLSILSFPGTVLLKLENPNLKVLVQDLTVLRELYLDGVNISANGNEWCQALSFSLTNLQVLSLSTCFLSGPIHPDLVNLHSLSVIRLDLNNLSSPVPDFFADFSNLKSLRFSNCGLNGKFPEKIFQVQTLETLDLSNNKLLRGSVPHFLMNNSLRTLIDAAVKDNMAN
ncbi:hypothetical protein LWI29_017397 [Acer saccharum]|uniref:Leucine-rich repeat-containing N-terminal plant-type domain-containing protein n=1 Tax=Acer saccharum TaxID=4024 RepID=A0AA39RY00_ACESA|nr:hypothetical protein LWI29_017397 [Acer saccharum]